MIGDDENTPTRPGVRRNTSEFEPITTGEWRVKMLDATNKPHASPLAIAAFVATAIGVFVAAVGLSLSIGDRLYYKATDGSALAADVRATLATVKEINEELRRDRK